MGESSFAWFSRACPRWMAVLLLAPLGELGCSNGFSSEVSWLGGRVSSAPDDRASSPPPEPLRLLAAGATEDSVRDTMERFELESGLSVAFEFGAVGALRDRVLAGEAADVVVVTPVIIQALEAQQRVRAGSRVDLGQIGGGIAVRAGDPLPAIDTPGALQQALLDA